LLVVFYIFTVGLVNTRRERVRRIQKIGILEGKFVERAFASQFGLYLNILSSPEKVSLCEINGPYEFVYGTVPAADAQKAGRPFLDLTSRSIAFSSYFGFGFISTVSKTEIVYPFIAPFQF
jgi:hypothetical protein